MSALRVSPLLSVLDLQQRLGDAELRVIDCRFALADTAAGEMAFLKARIPGARYAHLDRDLSDHALPASEGRHPLPSPETFAKTLTQWGITPESQVVVYDDAGGALAAARLWWMLLWMGHTHVQVLDGGWSAWLAQGAAVDSTPLAQAQEANDRPVAVFTWSPRAELLAYVSDIETRSPQTVLVDARAAERFRGDVEPLDPRAGHIPGAINRPFSQNLSAGHFRESDELKGEWSALLQGAPPENAILYCGSGVTACHNALALVHAGLPLPRLYAPSWSGWVSDSAHGVATGPG